MTNAALEDINTAPEDLNEASEDWKAKLHHSLEAFEPVLLGRSLPLLQKMLPDSRKKPFEAAPQTHV